MTQNENKVSPTDVQVQIRDDGVVLAFPLADKMHLTYFLQAAAMNALTRAWLEAQKAQLQQIAVTQEVMRAKNA